MGLMNATAPLIVTPHPVTLEDQRTLAAELQEGERLGAFLARTVPDYGGDLWEVRINGVLVPHEVMDRVRPKGGTVIEVRGVVKKTALMIVALIALTVFTMGVGTAMVAAGYGAVAVGLAQAAIYAVGSLIINKVLGPKRPKPSASDAGSVYSLGAARNQSRPYEPLGLLLGGPLRIAPDVASNPYSWYEADDQYMAFVLSPGINVGRVEALYNGDALLSSFEGVTVWHNGFSQMPGEDIPLYSNADTINGGALEAEKGRPSAWVQRTSSMNTIRLKVDVDFMLFDTTSKGKPKDNQETIEVQYRVVGATNWMHFGSFAITSRSQKQQRRSYSLDVNEGQYEVRVRIAGRNTDGSGATSDFTWSTLTSIQKDAADYAGVSRIGIRIKATGQLNGQPDEIRCVAHSAPIPVWTGSSWSTQETDNPGATILAYARGYRDENGKLIAGIGLDDVQIDIEALKAFMLFCQDNGYGYSHYVQDVRNHDDLLGAVALAGFGQITWAGGRLSVVWAGAEQPLSGVVNMATIKKGQFQVDYTLANAADGIEYSYFDATDWTTKTLRVAAPGVTTMLNPATVQGEGITNEAHAARMARYHLAQSLYQYKDISYSTDIEHLSYRRLSVLALQHDLTQWGCGGRLVSASLQAGVLTLQLDEPVPAPSAGNAYIGLRVPGERVYRVFGVQAFSGTSDTLRLTGAWPADAPLPGATADNPAHDTIWIYDFKQTPGYRVRVTGIEPESDLKGAKVSVVPEPPEFWNYVLTGQYVPPVSTNPSMTRPVASGLAVTEQQVVQGDTVFTELTVTFEISGPVGNVVVLVAGSDGVLAEVAQTNTRTASWRISRADQYTVVVRPFSPEGQVGVSASVTYVTAGADVPPLLVDYFEVDELPGGVRMYTWGFLAESIQSPDFAGVEVRYIAGVVTEPAWDTMTPIGESGYHTVPFEAVVPKAGNWTFACRSRNSSGELSTGMRVVSKPLGQNLGEQMQETWEEAERANQRIGQEIIDRLAGDLAAVNEALAKAREYTDVQVAALNGILEDITGADEWSADRTYPVGDFVRREGTLYRSLAENTNVVPGSDPAMWQEIGDYASVGDALAASISMATQNASDIQAEARKLEAVMVRMPAGEDRLASEASVSELAQATSNDLGAMGQRVGSVEARVPEDGQRAASAAQLATVDQARADGDGALSQRIDQATAQLEGKASAEGLSLLRSEVQDVDERLSATSQALTQVRSTLGNQTNLVSNSALESLSGWSIVWDSGAVGADLVRNRYGFDFPRGESNMSIRIPPYTVPGNYVQVRNSRLMPVDGGRTYWLQALYSLADGLTLAFGVDWFDASGNSQGESNWVVSASGGGWPQFAMPMEAPPTASTARLWFRTQTQYDMPTERLAWVARPMFSEALEGQVAAPHYAPGMAGIDAKYASATQAIETRATQLENGQSVLQASYTWALDVNGRAIGMTSVNNGSIGRIDFVADVFGIVDPNNTGSSTFEGGRWMTRSGGYLLAHGKPFGTTGDILMWIGVGSNVDACSKANGLFWIDNRGNSYFGGSLAAGTLRNAVQTTTTQTLGTELINGPFTTNGNTRSVIVSYRRDVSARKNANGSSGFIAGAGANTATVRVYRQIGTAAEELWQTLNVSGNIEILNESDGPDYLRSSWGGGITVNDSSSPLELVRYRAVIVAFANQAFTHSSGSYDAQEVSQNLSITSVEQ